MGILEKGGNAFDAAVATGLTLQVVEPHLNGPSGEMPAVLYSKKKDKVEVLCGQGPAPAGATIEHYRSKGLTAIPGDGLLATVIPGAWDGWMLLLRDYGRLTLRDILEPAIHYAGQGHPLLPRVSSTIGGLADFFHDHWPTSFETWLPGGICPGAHANFCNPKLAATWTRILSEAESKSGREEQIEAARDAFYRRAFLRCLLLPRLGWNSRLAQRRAPYVDMSGYSLNRRFTVPVSAMLRSAAIPSQEYADR